MVKCRPERREGPARAGVVQVLRSAQDDKLHHQLPFTVHRSRLLALGVTSPSPSPTACPSCGAAASGRFCAACGTALAGATCGTCDAPLTPGAHFCHRCGTRAGTSNPVRARGAGDVMPWAVAAIALVA